MTSNQTNAERVIHIARGISDAVVRANYIDQICTYDPSLRVHLEGLVDEHETGKSFSNSASGQIPETIAADDIEEGPGARFGCYRLMEQIGEGGMGAVFVAKQDHPIQRRVALKVIKPGMDSKTVIARFEAERQALALMDHTNIAKVLDAGTTTHGRPFFVMELVSGIAITEYCDEHKLSIRERLSLFAQVCQAIQHAHQKGIIHRDVKPSNVLVTEQDGRSIPKVIDFGVAKAIGQRLTDQTIYTSFQAVIGTPLYMSPEQAALSNVDVDTRSDVYSLGVLLYELLTGTTPIDRNVLGEAAQHEVLRIIREQAAMKPSARISSLGEHARIVSKGRRADLSTLGKAVRGDLDWIVMKAIAKDRARRYETASALANDVRAFLDNGAVSARPPSAWYQLHKVLQRNKVFVATVLSVFFALSAGLCIALWGLNQAYIGEEQARSERDRFESLLRDYEPLVLNEIFDKVFSGDSKSAIQAIEDAETVGVEPEKLAVLRAIQQIFSGEQESYKMGIASLESMLQKNENHEVALSMLVWAHVAGYGDLDVFATSGQRHRDLDPPENDFEKVVWAAGLSVEGRFRGLSSEGEGLRTAKDTLEEVVSRNPSWNLPRLLLARVLSDYAVDTGNPQFVSDAIDEQLSQIKSARPGLLRSPFWLAQQLHVYSVGCRMLPAARSDQCRAEADRLSELLIDLGYEDYILGRLERALYFTNLAEIDNASDFAFAIEEWKVFDRQSQNDFYGSLFGGLLVRNGLMTGNLSEADEYYENVSLPFAAYTRGNREKTLEICANLRPDETLLGEFWAHTAMFACGHDSREEATEYFKRLKSSGSYPPWIELPLDLFLGDTSPDDVPLSQSGIHRAWALQVTGNYLVNVDRTAEAKDCFFGVIEADAFMMDTHHWAHAFWIMLEDDPNWFEKMNPDMLE